jgi:hypothetical protein
MNFTAEWLTIFQWLENSSISSFFRQSLWLYPAVEIVHIVGFAILAGAAILFDIRLLGFSPQLSVANAARHLLFWAQISLIAVLPSGLILFMVDATTLVSNTAFQVKMALLVIAGVNAWVFHAFTSRNMKNRDTFQSTPTGAKIAGILSILIWISIISCGRLIAYV